jgi:hypothetical protein
MSFIGYGTQVHSCLDGQEGDFICCEKIHHLLEAAAFNAVINFGFESLSDRKWQMKDPRPADIIPLYPWWNWNQQLCEYAGKDGKFYTAQVL